MKRGKVGLIRFCTCFSLGGEASDGQRSVVFFLKNSSKRRRKLFAFLSFCVCKRRRREREKEKYGDVLCGRGLWEVDGVEEGGGSGGVVGLPETHPPKPHDPCFLPSTNAPVGVADRSSGRKRALVRVSGASKRRPGRVGRGTGLASRRAAEQAAIERMPHSLIA